MDNQELLDNLTRLQQSLESIDSARQMVDRTIAAYDGVATQVQGISDTLSLVSRQLEALIGKLAENRDVLSAAVDQRMTTAIDQLETTSNSFAQQTMDAMTQFKDGWKNYFEQMDLSVKRLVNESEQTLNQAMQDAKESQEQATHTLEVAASRTEAVCSDIVNEVKFRHEKFLAASRKQIMYSTIILSVLIAINIVIALLR